MLLKFIRINPYSLLHLSCKDKLFVMKSINPNDFKVIGKMERVVRCDACAQQVLGFDLFARHGYIVKCSLIW